MGKVKAFGGAAKAEFLGDGNKITKMAQFHSIDTYNISMKLVNIYWPDAR